MNENMNVSTEAVETAEESKPEKKKSPIENIYDIVSVIATAVIAVVVAFTFIFRTVGIVGNSMVPTLNNNDRIILSAFMFEPENGDIVVTCQPNDTMVEDVLVKRVIATEGQTVDIDFTKGVVYVDGEALDEPYINEPTYRQEDFYNSVTVPEGYVFVMGDNRNHSTDSRDNRVGFIREEYILGKALFRLMPFGNFRIG